MLTMPEYIEREALLQDISETVLFSVRGGAELPTPEMRGANKVIDRIKSAPTADVVEVVRCKDCEFIKATKMSINKRPLRSCTLYKKPCYDDDFCSRGVRKGENDV